MSLVRDVLAAQSRPANEAMRLSSGVGERYAAAVEELDGDAAPGAVLAETRSAFDHVNHAIADERNPRPVTPPEHLAAFDGDPADTAGDDVLRDAAEDDESDVRNHVHFTADGQQDASEDEDDQPFSQPDIIAGDDDDDEADPGEEAEPDEENPTPDAGEEPAPDAAAEAGDSDDGGDAHTVPQRRILPGVPSPTDAYAEPFLAGFSGGEEIAPPAAVSPETPDSPRRPTPSPKSTEPPESIGKPTPDREPGLKDRLRESAEQLRERVSESRPRTRVLVGGAAATLLVVVAMVFSLTGGRGKPPAPEETVAAPPAPTSTAASQERPTAPLKPGTVSALCAADSDPVAPFDTDRSKAWVCQRANGIDGSVLNVTFRKPVAVTEIMIVPGFDYVDADGTDEWNRHRLVTKVTWRMGGSSYTQQITPTRTGSVMKFPSVITKEMSMTITASTRPPGAKDGADDTTAVSRIVITGYPLDPAG